ncbi:MAG: lipolytic enzyme family, partial [Candidatus Paceibacter sp.]|nr:lipolytic enzyme family [Candidatus Paceibacter sp.]
MEMRLSKILAIIACYIAFSHVQAQTIDRPLNVIAFGDSVTVGTGTTIGRNYVQILSERTGIAIENQGISGNTTAQALARVDTDIISKDPDIVIVFLGGNDILQNIDAPITLSNIRTIVTRIQSSGAKVILVSIHDSFILDDYEEGYQDIANETGAYFVSGVLRGIIGRSEFMFDAVHPNNAGHKII